MITLEQNCTTQKYLKKRTGALDNIDILQRKLRKPVMVFEMKIKSKQKNSKKKGLSVEWVYQPKTRLLDRAHSLSSIEKPKMSRIYVRITVYDEIHKQEYNDSKKSHLIPLEALERLFWVADAIRTDKLFDLYEDIPLKDWGKSETPEEPDPKRECRKREFFERTHFVYLFGHENVLYDHDEMPKGVSNFTISFRPKHTKEEDARLSWMFTCWDALYDADEIDSSGICCFAGNNIKETAIAISQDQLLQIVDGIYQSLCHLLDESSKRD